MHAEQQIKEAGKMTGPSGRGRAVTLRNGQAQEEGGQIVKEDNTSGVWIAGAMQQY